MPGCNDQSLGQPIDLISGAYNGMSKPCSKTLGYIAKRLIHLFQLTDVSLS
ncbi:hypothetical protein D3C79_532650 [compost metagenome]